MVDSAADTPEEVAVDGVEVAADDRAVVSLCDEVPPSVDVLTSAPDVEPAVEVVVVLVVLEGLAVEVESDEGVVEALGFAIITTTNFFLSIS